MAESTETDPRYPAAFQRGYQEQQGGTAQRGAPTAQQAAPTLRRPRRPTVLRAAGTPPGRQAAEANRGRRAEPDPTTDLVFDDAPAEGAEAVTPLDEAAAASRPALLLDKRLPLTLTVIGVALVLAGLLGLWWVTTLWYSTEVPIEGLNSDQYLRTLLPFISPSALTVGLLSLCGAIVVRAVRPSQE